MLNIIKFDYIVHNFISGCARVNAVHFYALFVCSQKENEHARNARMTKPHRTQSDRIYRTRKQSCVQAHRQILNGRANLHDGLARVDRTAGDTWRRPRGEDILLVQVKQVLHN